MEVSRLLAIKTVKAINRGLDYVMSTVVTRAFCQHSGRQRKAERVLEVVAQPRKVASEGEVQEANEEKPWQVKVSRAKVRKQAPPVPRRTAEAVNTIIVLPKANSKRKAGKITISLHLWTSPGNSSETVKPICISCDCWCRSNS